MPPVQTQYNERMRVGLPGQLADMTNWNGDTRLVETEAGIGFGLACGQGTLDKSVVIGAAAANRFVGISVKDVTLPGAQGDKYVEGQNMTVLTQGDIFVVAGGDVVEGADVTFNATTGVLSSAATSGSQFAIAGARWMTTTASGQVGKVRLSGHLPAA